MSRRSTHFFISGNNPIAKLPEYLEAMLGKMAKEMPNINKEEGGDVMEEDHEDVDIGEATEENGDSNGDANSKVADEQTAQLAAKLSEHWLKLAPKFGIADDKVNQIKAKDSSDEEKCLDLIKLWQEIEGEGATKDEIIYILEGLKLVSCIEGVF